MLTGSPARLKSHGLPLHGGYACAGCPCSRGDWESRPADSKGGIWEYSNSTRHAFLGAAGGGVPTRFLDCRNLLSELAFRDRDPLKQCQIDVWQSAIETLIMHRFSPRTVRFVARAALATGSGSNDEAWRARLTALASYEAIPRPGWPWFATLINIPRVHPRAAVSMLFSFLVGVVLFAAFARNGAFDERVGVTASANELAFPPINVEEGGSATLRPDSGFGVFQQ